MPRKFLEIIADSFDEIKKNFQSGLVKAGYEFDEDIFMDTLIKCDSSVKEKDMTKTDAVKYFWTAYVNNIKTDIKHDHFLHSLDVCDIADTEDDPIDTPYNSDIDRAYNIIIDAVSEKFGEHIADAWRLHNGYGYSYKELESMGYDDVKFNYEFKRIAKYIRQELPKKDPIFGELYKHIKNHDL